MSEGHDETIQQAHAEWDYETVENHITGHDYPLSVPCQLRFSEPPRQDIDRFHDALEERGYTALDSHPERALEGDGPCYDGEVCSTDHYNRVKVLVFRGDLVRLYPHDDYVPTVDELAALVEAIETGFGASLEHDPIEREGEA